MISVYGICGGDGKIRYVGQTNGTLARRLIHHKCYAKLRHKTRIHKWIATEIKANRRIHIFLIERDAIWNDSEMRLIAWYRRNGARLLNLTDGGEGTIGYRHSGRKRPDLAARNTAGRGKPGHPTSAETKQTIRDIHRGRKCPWTSEMNRQRAGKPGRKQSPQEREKRSESITKWWQDRRIGNNDAA